MALPGLPVHLFQPGISQVPAADGRPDQRRDQGMEPAAFLGSGAALTIRCMSATRMSWHNMPPMTGVRTARTAAAGYGRACGTIARRQEPVG
jgi:hypothetical protein